jgi:hypothetical protein
LAEIRRVQTGFTGCTGSECFHKRIRTFWAIFLSGAVGRENLKPNVIGSAAGTLFVQKGNKISPSGRDDRLYLMPQTNLQPCFNPVDPVNPV